MFKKVLIVTVLFLATACMNEPKNAWKESEIFYSGSYSMIGEKDRLGFIYDESEVTRFYPDKEQKYMWHFWGEDEELDGDLRIIATHETGGEPIPLVGVSFIGGSHNGADGHIPSMMSLPKSGMWKLSAYFDDKLFGTVYVKVHDRDE